MKQVFLALLTVLLGVGLMTSCGKKESGWKQFITDYEKFATDYIAEMKEVSAGTREAISPELEARMETFDQSFEEMSRGLSPIEQVKFTAEFLRVTGKIIEANADDINETVESFSQSMEESLSNAQ